MFAGWHQQRVRQSLLRHAAPTVARLGLFADEVEWLAERQGRSAGACIPTWRGAGCPVDHADVRAGQPLVLVVPFRRSPSPAMSPLHPLDLSEHQLGMSEVPSPTRPARATAATARVAGRALASGTGCGPVDRSAHLHDLGFACLSLTRRRPPIHTTQRETMAALSTRSLALRLGSVPRVYGRPIAASAPRNVRPVRGAKVRGCAQKWGRCDGSGPCSLAATSTHRDAAPRLRCALAWTWRHRRRRPPNRLLCRLAAAAAGCSPRLLLRRPAAEGRPAAGRRHVPAFLPE